MDKQRSNNPPYHWSYDSVDRCKRNRLVKSYYHPIEVDLEYHTHDFYEINIITSGSGRHFIGERELSAECGDVFVIPPLTGHGYRSLGDLSVFHLLLSPVFMDRLSPLFDRVGGYGMLFNVEPRLRSMTDFSYYLRRGDLSFEKLISLIESVEAVSECKNEVEELDSALRAGLLISYLSGAMKNADTGAKTEASDNRTLSVIGAAEYLERHFDEPLSVADLAEKCAMSYSSFLRHFKRLFAKTPVEYQAALRVERAKKRLLGSSDSILKIAMELGYYDSAHFIREFERHTKKSPAEYRRRG